jgi:hypothetical protein
MESRQEIYKKNIWKLKYFQKLFFFTGCETLI